MKRRDFLLSLAAAACLPGCHTAASPGLPPGKLLGAGLERGHRLRGRDFPAPSETRQVGVAIVGGGIAGLSAAWKLNQAGFGDFRLFELEDETGGNARAGHNAVSAYPWGAHYLPLPGREARDVRELLADLGVLRGDPYAEAPAYDERFLCFAPQERLYRHGLWQEGLLPQIGATKRDQEQYRRFFDLLERYRQRRSAAGERAFAIPAALSSRDPELLALDTLSMRAFMLQHGLDSEPLNWYVNYGCRDGHAANASADGEQVLTWPEGNAWLARQMRQRFSEQVETAALVHRIEESSHHVELDVYLARENRTVRWRANRVIFAAPVFVLPHVVADLDSSLRDASQAVQYAPWLVANLTLGEALQHGNGAALAWDNVLYDSPALGYVNALQQSLGTSPGPTVLTYYWALPGNTAAARQALYETPRDRWAERILADLSRPHPDIRDKVQQLDIWRWGHAMSKPVSGWIWSAARQQLGASHRRVHLAHADLSGFSIFEEANYWGVKAAQDVLRRLGFPPRNGIGSKT
ncbi:amino oxidase [Sulfurimicrobium lacus]|uniref:Amino oxidase n=1 Tax=Sulfurimicrobium lacus TaxID=2715678 RepID=A0A6F8VDK9_9PROT|nr:NAD(P)/FAD-dependent oxidoreductase [Sulfurimicrobium lacus]BCB27241.1 amino oxidase [Sulfurimicrobium lacus]